MAFVSKVGSLLKQSGSKHASMGLLSSSNSPFFQAIRSMSSAKLFVGGLSYGTDEMGLRQAFQEYGEVIEAKVITDRDSGRSRGFGFVSYTSADAANTALQDMDGKDLHGRRIRVSFAQERPRPSFGGGGYGGAGGYSGGGGYGGAGGYSGGGGYGDRSNNLGGYGGRNQNAGGGDDLFGGGVGGGSGVSPGGGNEDDVVGNLSDGSGEIDGGDDSEGNDYANTSNK
ncbi:putative RNA recognition motif domain, nucleotide-binding alpha-beta plait domain superfamily [Helianthus annuus]|nr:putative RNA recognition motif domain, nucleotide-binding alpha-beta plait domain superfamily [Helianthus annuus]